MTTIKNRSWIYKRAIGIILIALLAFFMTACPPEPEQPIVDPTFTGGHGIVFKGSGSFTQAEINAINAEIAGLNLADFAGYITSWTRTKSGGRAIILEGDPGEEKAVIFSDGSMGNILADLTAGKDAAEDARHHPDNIAYINGVDIRVPAAAGLTPEEIENLIERLTTALNRDDVANNANRGDLNIIEITGIVSNNLSNYAGGIIRGTVGTGALGIAIRTRVIEGWSGFAYAHDANIHFLAGAWVTGTKFA